MDKKTQEQLLSEGSCEMANAEDAEAVIAHEEEPHLSASEEKTEVA